ncbi:MAG: nucleotide exchange factor GrpE [Candidatus Omnitrophica bacterium]|nr:nucleotide exchange factor GrpE [Candidatus Omnitrophota bacterium]MBU4303429.1 nucleotide exchange factor GrpE [Candidatus Omnitrophota bacterium]MBU4418821.1 nucleotide exchange factor GrpE [Candidatus Omnitrophota bacterium]MBU4467127.1 nucleotide exchange factor GrpE [Candidatus Omnitrophota bacterium]MCG2708102.1 nucleotide exchange factor GrpE [Candidatus Omnitrophota bacterium]
MKNMEEHKNNQKGTPEDTHNQKKEEKVVTLIEGEYLALLEEVKKGKDGYDKMLRNQADLENTRKRLDREKQEFVKFANEGLILDLLNVLDDLERTVDLAQTGKEDLSAFVKGVEMILAHLYEMLKNHGVKPIEAEGKIFDPNFHEALMQVENKELPEHTIIEVLQKGYLIHGRILRTAKVKVSKKSM